MSAWDGHAARQQYQARSEHHPAHSGVAQAKPCAVPCIIKFIPILQKYFHGSGDCAGAGSGGPIGRFGMFECLGIGSLCQANGSMNPVPALAGCVVFDEAQAFLSSVVIDHSVILQAGEFRQRAQDIGLLDRPP